MNFEGLQVGELIEHIDWKSFYDGIHSVSGKAVIIEVLDERRGATADDIEHFKERSIKLFEINHPNISKCLAHGEWKGMYFLAMEKESDDRLIDHLGRGEYLPPLEATRLVLDMANALEAIHKGGDVHGQLNPTNVLFNSQGQVKLRKVFSYQNTKEWCLDVISRRPHYAPPELIRMEELEPKSDHYSLGTIFFQLLTGRPPYDHKDFKEIWKQHLEGDIPTLPKDVSDYGELESIVNKMLAKRPKLRYGSTKDLVQDLEELEDELMMEMELEEDISDSFSEPAPLPKKKSSSPGETFSGKLGPKSSRSSSPRYSSSRSIKNAKSPGESFSGKLGPGVSRSFSKSKKGPSETRSSGGLKPQSHGRRKSDGPSRQRAWKQNSSGGQLYKAAPRKKTPPPKKGVSIPAILGGVAVVTICGSIFAYWAINGIGPDLDQLEKQESPRVQRKLIVIQREDPKSKTDSKAKLKTSREALLVETNDAGMSQQDKIKMLSDLAKDGSEQAIAKILFFLEDDDAEVRLVANQLYRDVKSGALVTAREESEDRIDIGDEAFFEGDFEDVVERLQDLSMEENAWSQLKIALEHPQRMVRRKALSLMASLNDERFDDVLLDYMKRFPSDMVAHKLTSIAGPDFWSQLLELAKVGEEGKAIQWLPLLMDRKDIPLDTWGPIMVDRDSLTFLIALELAAKGEVGKNILLKTLWNEPSARTATLVLSALRETELNEANLMRLELLNGKFSEEVDLYLSSILVARGRDNKDMIDKTTSDFKALMVIDDGGDNPPPEVLESLLPLLGSGSKRVDKKMLNTIALSGERTVETMQNIVEGQYPTSIKEQVIDVLYQQGAVSALLDIYRSKALRVEVRQHIEEAIKKSEGDWSLLISQSDLDAESKIKLLLDSEGEQAASAVAEVAMAAEKKAQTKVVKMILDAYPQCGDAIDMMLASSSDDDLKIALLKGLERMGPESGLDGTMSSLSSNNSKVQMYALKNLFSKLDGSDERWATIFKAELSESSAEKVIAKVDPENEAYETIMMDSLYHDSKKVRLAALERMNRTKAFLSGPPMINPLVTDEDAQVRNQLLNTLINDQEPSNPIALIWASQQGSASTRKKMGVALAKLSSDKNIQEELLLAMSEPYDTKIKSQVLSFLDKNNVDVLPKVISLLREDDPVSVQLFKKTIAQIGDKSKRSIVKEINEVKSLFQRTMLENALKNLKVNYRIDPQTGKYVVQ